MLLPRSYPKKGFDIVKDARSIDKKAWQVKAERALNTLFYLGKWGFQATL